ncbi:MAG: helix-turn-helix transcriptional regulator [Acutalibacteraceae bacterium]|nr:helix-turn-helix transcriptional regulator [Acutalibacteraceae bacterium]
MGNNQVLIQIGKRIALRRKELNITQEQLAETIGLSLQSISCIELGKKGIRPENLINLCIALDSTSDYFLFGKRSEFQMNSLVQKISTLNNEDYLLLESIVNRLNK